MSLLLMEKSMSIRLILLEKSFRLESLLLSHTRNLRKMILVGGFLKDPIFCRHQMLLPWSFIQVTVQKEEES